MDLSGKTAVITGVSAGIGRCLALGFMEKGAKVAGIDLLPSPDALDLFMRGDIAEQAALEDFAGRVRGTLGRVDILVNNAMLTGGGLDGCGYEDFLYAQRTGVAAPYYLTRLFKPAFAPGASVLNISSTRACQSQKNTESYTAAKGGVQALTHALAMSLSGLARVNAIAPGWIDTKESGLSDADRAQHPAGRAGKPEDILAAALFLCSEKASFITGQTLVVDGGMSKRMIYHNDEGWHFEPRGPIG